VNPHDGVFSVRHREYLAQFGNTAHFGGAWLNEVDRLRFKQMLEIHQRRRVFAGGDWNACLRNLCAARGETLIEGFESELTHALLKIGK
jgi:hypothetical protein